MSSKRRSSSSTVSINMNSNNSGSSIVDDCIVLYPYIYIALLAVHTNQKRFQCEKPREKRAVLRERKEALGSPVNKVDRVEGSDIFVLLHKTQSVNSTTQNVNKM